MRLSIILIVGLLLYIFNGTYGLENELMTKDNFLHHELFNLRKLIYAQNSKISNLQLEITAQNSRIASLEHELKEVTTKQKNDDVVKQFSSEEGEICEPCDGGLGNNFKSLIHNNTKNTKRDISSHQSSAGRTIQRTTTSTAFFSYLTKNENGPSTHHMIAFDGVLLNEGSSYHYRLGSFICTDPGIYAFSWTIVANGYICSNIIVNDIAYAITYTQNTYHGLDTTTGFIVANVNAGDVVFVRTCDNYSNSGDILSTDKHRSTFSGFKIA